MNKRIAAVAVFVAAPIGLLAPAAAYADSTLPASACVSSGVSVGVGSGQIGPVTTPPQTVSVPVDQCTP